jgi:membrane fusion protein, multidrug efflux system
LNKKIQLDKKLQPNGKIQLNKKVIYSLIVVVLIGIASFIWKLDFAKTITKSENVILLSSADVLQVKQGSVDETVAFTGDLTALKQSVISSEIDAEVAQVLVNEAQFVTRGQTLAILDDTDLQQALSQQRALLSTARAKFELDKSKLERQKGLLDQGFISKIAYDELKTNYQSSLETVREQQAAVQRAQKQLSHTIIKAPFNGYVFQKNVDPGQIASKGNKLFYLANLDLMQIKAAIPGESIGKVKLNQVVSFKVDTSDKFYKGRITRLNPVAEAGTRSYFIYIDFSNREYKLKAGQFVKGQIILSSLSDTAYLSSDSVRILPNSETYVYAIIKNVVTNVPVKVLIKNNVANISAVSGINSGVLILGGNVTTVKPGDKVKILD